MKNKITNFLLLLFCLSLNVGIATAQQNHEYVDLGLPSGTLWATCNIGAENSWECGDYFAWGETSTKTTYTTANYKYFNGETYLTKYCNKDIWGSNGYTDSYTTLETTDDVAFVNWGSEWCMPTLTQWNELIYNCYWVWTEKNDKQGNKSRGYMVYKAFKPGDRGIRKYKGETPDAAYTENVPHIFLPTTGEKIGSRIAYHEEGGSYRSSSLDLSLPLITHSLNFESDNVYDAGWTPREYGISVRPVRCNRFVNDGFAALQQNHEYVDLGLPSGTLWATCNIGAENSWDYGDYFAWGETSPKETYSWDNYKYANGSYDRLTKYCTNKKHGNNGYIDGLKELEPKDDAATANWGIDWCMPSLDQIKELKKKCNWTWTSNNGIKGYMVTGPNGNSLFLPAAGCRSGIDLFSVGSYGDYWSRSLYESYPYHARYLYFNSSSVDRYYSFRYLGFSVRPVMCKN